MADSPPLVTALAGLKASHRTAMKDKVTKFSGHFHAKWHFLRSPSARYLDRYGNVSVAAGLNKQVVRH